MDFDVTREQWVERFSMRLSQLDPRSDPGSFVEIGHALWQTRGQVDPSVAADEAFAARQASAADLQSAHGAESLFERTERIPVEHITTAGEYVPDNAEWIARCVARVLALDPIIKTEEAQRSVSELAGLERWRLMKPEAAAEQLYTPIRPR